MLYFVEIDDILIISKGIMTSPVELPEGYIAVGKELYESIGNIPCHFTIDNGEIANVEFIEPNPSQQLPRPATLSEVDLLGQQLVEKELQILELLQENQVLGQQIVDLDLRLLMGGL